MTTSGTWSPSGPQRLSFNLHKYPHLVPEARETQAPDKSPQISLLPCLRGLSPFSLLVRPLSSFLLQSSLSSLPLRRPPPPKPHWGREGGNPYCFDDKTQSSLKQKNLDLDTDLGSFLGMEEGEMSVTIPSEVGKTPNNISVWIMGIQLMPGVMASQNFPCEVRQAVEH